MAKEKWNLSRIQEFVGEEGLGFCVEHGVLPCEIEDDHLAKLWSKARASLNDITFYLKEKKDNG